MSKRLVPRWARLWIWFFPAKPPTRPPVLERPRPRPVGEKVVLRAERDGVDSRFLDAWLDQYGDLHIDGQDLGPGTAMVSSDGEYEWFRTFRAAEVPGVVEALGGEPGQDVMAFLAGMWAGRGNELETRLREAGLRGEIDVWSG